MAGTAVPQPPVPEISSNAAHRGSGGGVAPYKALSPSDVNSFRVSAVIDCLYRHMHDLRKSDAVEFSNLCLSLARSIDFAVANNEVPNRSQEFPSLIKQVCQKRNDDVLLASIMVLMISVKSACQSGWFSNKDSEELNNLAAEIASGFGTVPEFYKDSCFSLSVITQIISRFYPRMRMGHVFACLEVKPGFDAYVTDFQISKNFKPAAGEKIRLFVAQTDNIGTSSCLVTPPKVNFLLNGKGVERRTNLFMDTCPQIPTVVTHLLKYGSNLLQAVGEFNGNYIVAVAFMREMPNPESSVLQDYKQPTTAAVDADSELIEGPSRVSLYCPISRQRIKTPVKGRSCNHIQCFDFNNYLEINSRRPFWRCPSCNQHVCFTDICIDRKMVKVLQEVAPNIFEIMISSDGSWNTVMESDETMDKPEDDKMSMREDESPQPADVVDLTCTDDATDAADNCLSDEMKNFDQFQFMSQITSSDPQVASMNDANQNNHQNLNDLWSEISMQTNGQPNAQNVISSPSALALQLQHQFGNPSVHNESGRLPSIARHVTQMPDSGIQQNPRNSASNFAHISLSAAQAFCATKMPVTAQSSAAVLQSSATNGASTFIPNSFSGASEASSSAPNIPQAHHVNPHRVLPSLHQIEQTIAQQSQFLAQLRQQNAGFASPNQAPNAVSNERQSSSQPILRAPRSTIPQSSSQVQSSMLSSRNIFPPRSHPGNVNIHKTGAPSSQQSRSIAAANRAGRLADTSMGSPSFSRNPDISNIASPADQRANVGVASQPITTTDTCDPSDLNWRPSVRMRGALSGQAYAEALNQFIIQPSQHTQAARPISDITSVLVDVPVLQASEPDSFADSHQMN